MPSKEYIAGIHAVESVLRNDPANVLELWIQKNRDNNRLDNICELAEQFGVHIQQVGRKEIERRCRNEKSQGVVAVYKSRPAASESFLNDVINRDKAFFLVLDGVQDPHNLGACMRTADAAGVNAVIAPKNRATGITPVVRKVASGAVETLPFVQVTNLARFLRQLTDQGFLILGAAGDAKCSIHECSTSNKLALVMGAEEKGLRRLTREHCDQLVSIPMFGQVESLNISVATGICLFELQRRLHAVKKG